MSITTATKASTRLTNRHESDIDRTLAPIDPTAIRLTILLSAFWVSAVTANLPMPHVVGGLSG